MQKAIDLDKPGDTNDLADATDYYEIGIAQMALGKYKEAADAFANAARLQADPFAAADSFAALGRSRYALHQYAEAVEAFKQALNRRMAVDSYARAAESAGMAKALLDWNATGKDAAHLEEAEQAWKQAIAADNSEATAAGTDVNDFDDWVGLGKTYLALAKRKSNANYLPQAVDAFDNALRVSPNPGLSASVWYSKGSAYREMAKGDSKFYLNAVAAWEQARDLDNPEATAAGSDVQDIADWYQIAETYRDWSRSHPEKLQLVRDALSQALKIPVTDADHDHIWHNAALRLQKELGQ